MCIFAGTLYLYLCAVSGSDPGRSYGTLRVPTGRCFLGGSNSSYISSTPDPGRSISTRVTTYMHSRPGAFADTHTQLHIYSRYTFKQKHVNARSGTLLTAHTSHKPCAQPRKMWLANYNINIDLTPRQPKCSTRPHSRTSSTRPGPGHVRDLLPRALHSHASMSTNACPSVPSVESRTQLKAK